MFGEKSDESFKVFDEVEVGLNRERKEHVKNDLEPAGE